MSMDRMSTCCLARAKYCKLSYLPMRLFLSRTERPTSRLLSTLKPEGALTKASYRISPHNYASDTDSPYLRAYPGFEGLTTSPCGETLYVLLQSAPVQDGGPNKAKNRYTRFLKYNVKNLNKIKLEAEYIVPLPQSSKGNTLAQSELLWLNDNQFLVLARDGNGAGDSDTSSKYKCVSPLTSLITTYKGTCSILRAADLIDTSGATNIAGTKFDSPSNPAAPGGVLDSSITPTAYQTFVQYINSTQLARFGLHNGGVLDQTLIAAKWEALALAPAHDKNAKDDYFLFTLVRNISHPPPFVIGYFGGNLTNIFFLGRPIMTF